MAGTGNTEGAAILQPTDRQTAGTGSASDAGLQPLTRSVIAIAGHDPAVLQIWDLQVFTGFTVLCCASQVNVSFSSA